MEKEVGSDVIKATQTSLGKHVKRPALTEKLLKKPPFRFLHDIVTSVLKSNRFFEGLFEEDELISDNVKDRDSKILFLNKVISVIALTTGKNLSVKSSKIVAGQEPEKTNELLQSLAYALDSKLSSDEAVKKYKENSKAPQASDIKSKEKEVKAVKKSNDSKKLASRSSENLKNVKKESVLVNKNDKSKINNPKSNRKETGVSKPELQIKKSQNLKAIDKKPSVESITQPSITDTTNQEQNTFLPEKELKQNEEINVVHEVLNTSTLKTQKEAEETESSRDLKSEPEVEKILTVLDKFAENELNSSLSSQDLMDVQNDKADDISFERSAQESAKIIAEYQVIETRKETIQKSNEEADETLSTKKSRPVLIPKHKSFDLEIKTKELVRNNSHDTQTPEVVRPLSVRPSSSRPGAPRLREKIENFTSENENLILGKVNIIAENARNDEEEEESGVIIVEQHGVGSGTTEDQQEAIQLSSNEHGHLVQQILNSQKELSHVTGKTEIEWQYGAQKAKEASSQEIEQLRFNIQALSRVANPLGKLLDHIQEDVEVMRQELLQWTNVYEEVSKDMVKQKAASEETLVPLQTRVKQLDVDIEEKRDKINDINILIHKNTTRIQKLLANGKVQ